MSEPAQEARTDERMEELVRLAHQGATRAQDENRAAGVPNVYSIDGVLYYELPNGELTTEDPWLPSPPPSDE